MSSEVHKYIEDRLEKNANLFDTEVINFPKEKNIKNIKVKKLESQNVWKINDETNDDQLKAVTGICFMLGALIVMGLYSNLL